MDFQHASLGSYLPYQHLEMHLSIPSVTFTYNCCQQPNACVLQLRLAPVFEVPGGSSLAYIGTASSTAQREELEHRSRRFRLGDKKEAAGVCRGRGDQPGMYGY